MSDQVFHSGIASVADVADGCSSVNLTAVTSAVLHLIAALRRFGMHPQRVVVFSPNFTDVKA